ncbi:hypothetical protein LIER_05595 [Lithospermum erythrorhizon]|uniref:Uncharacterized protein n=1 Tax=Lithospermum erythrorhizon TaxID=34254 RepID=A0AAV3P196_LITER
MGSKDSADVPSLPQVTVPSAEGQSTPSHQSKAHEASLDDIFERHEIPRASSLIEKHLDSRSSIQCTWYPGMPNKSNPRSPRHSPDPSVGFMPIGSEERYKSDHPYFVDDPYVLPSGVNVTDDSVSHFIHSLATDMLNNCMLGAEILGAMKVQPPSRLYQQFAHYELRLKSNHAATERKLTSELEVVKADSQQMDSDLEKSRDDLSRVQSRLDGCMVEKEDLHSRLAKAEDFATSAVEDFKVSHDYFELLKGNTTTLVLGFYQNVHADFPVISSLLTNEDLGADDDEEDEGDEDGDGEDDAE